jgi:hypothetical protein
MVNRERFKGGRHGLFEDTTLELKATENITIIDTSTGV